MKRLIALVFVTFLLCGCGSNGKRDRVTNFRFFNGLPEASSLDLFLDYEPEVEDVGYLESTGYFKVDSGRRVLQVSQSRSFSPIVDQTTTLRDDVDYTLIACGTLENPSSILLRDDNDPGNNETTKIRVVNVGKKLGSSDIYISGPNQDIADLAPSEESLGYRGVSDYLRSVPGRYVISVTDTNSKEILAQSTPQLFEPKKVYTAIVGDPKGGENTPRLVILTDR